MAELDLTGGDCILTWLKGDPAFVWVDTQVSVVQCLSLYLGSCPMPATEV